MAHRVIRMAAIIGAGLLAGTAQAEVGCGEGALGVAAIERGDLTTAARVLAPVNLADARDPARLINVAAVYKRSGKMAEARAALIAAARAPDTALVLSSGEERSSRAIVRSALARVDVQVASR